MYFKQFYLGCLAHASYLIGSEGEAVVVDPQRDVEIYLQEAAEQHLTIRWILETHLHADFVSGHCELAERTGATIVMGARAGATFPHRAVQDGDEIQVGSVNLRFLETPGHTPEGMCILACDLSDPAAPPKLLTGDTLFIGDVGRPDLAGSKGYTAQDMAAMLYDSLRHKVMTLDDAVEVYPAHGAGSMCGRNISKDTSSTIGVQKKMNYALQPMSRDEFIRMMTTDLPEAPVYFSKDAELNRTGARALEQMERPPAMTPDEVLDKANQGAVLLDVRPAGQFGSGHIPGAINIGLSGQFASWAGTLLDMKTPIVVIAEDVEGVDEAVMRLARVGIESACGYLEGGIYAWDQSGYPLTTVAQMPITEVRDRLESDPSVLLLDVRRPGEFKAGSISGALHHELAHLLETASAHDRNREVIVVCQSGYRSSIATSILRRLGFSQVSNAVGGMNAWNSMQAEGAASVSA